MKILLIGKNGQLGWELQRTLAPLGEITAIDFPEINLAIEDQVRVWVRDVHPPGILAEEAKALNAAFIHYSTDYVFDGTKDEAYIESDLPNPINSYGWSKLGGDQNVQQVGGSFLIFRPAWVYSLREGGFVKKVLHWARSNETLKIVSDQVGSPTCARMLAEISALVLAKAGNELSAWIKERSGIYHLGGDGAVSRLEWAKAILDLDPKKEEQIVKEILPAKTSDFPTPAKRPLHSPLNCDLFANTFGMRLPGWEDALRLVMGA